MVVTMGWDPWQRRPPRFVASRRFDKSGPLRVNDNATTGCPPPWRVLWSTVGFGADTI